MRYDYIVILKKDQEKYVDFISGFLCLFSIIIFSFDQLQSHQFRWYLAFPSVIILAGIIFNLIRSIKKIQCRYRYFLLITGVTWIVMPFLQWLAPFFFILTFLEFQAKYPLEIGFTKQTVVINTIIKKKFQWTDFKNVILKDGILTLDFKNNRLLQKEVLDDDEPDRDEDEFNDFCREQLNRSELIIN